MPTWDSKELEAVLALPREERKRMVSATATKEGLKAAISAAVVWTPVCALLKYRTPPTSFFNSKLNTSARTAVLISAPLLAFGIVSEQVASRLGNPEAYLNQVVKQRASELNVFKQFASALLWPLALLLYAAHLPRETHRRCARLHAGSSVLAHHRCVNPRRGHYRCAFIGRQ